MPQLYLWFALNVEHIFTSHELVEHKCSQKEITFIETFLFIGYSNEFPFMKDKYIKKINVIELWNKASVTAMIYWNCECH